MSREERVAEKLMGMKLTTAELLDNGYQKCNTDPSHEYAEANYYKWVYIENKRAYHISLYHYIGKYLPNGNYVREGFELHMQLNTVEGETFDVELLFNEETTTLKSIELFAATIFERMECLCKDD